MLCFMQNLLCEYSVLHVQMRLSVICDKELGTVAVRPVVRHGNHTSNVVLK